MPKLTPLLHAESAQFLADIKTVVDLVSSFGSPLNILFPERLAENISHYEEAFKVAGVQGEIYFPLKPNKSAATIARASLTPVNVDVASEGELVHALTQGICANRIEATGPKNDRFLRLCVQHGVRIHLDSLYELERLLAMRKTCRHPQATPVFLRLGGLGDPKGLAADSRFGCAKDQYANALVRLKECAPDIQFLGFAFHLNAASVQDKVKAIDEALQLTLEAQRAGLSPTHLNIGGGFKINFLASETEWNEYLSAIKAGALGQGQTMAWNKSSLGFRAVDGRLAGSPDFHPHIVHLAGPDELKNLLEHSLPSFGNAPIKNVLNDLLLTLVIEPGRSLLDQVGLTLARVIEVKTSAQGERVIVLEMNRSNLNAGDLEFMSDPILVSNHNKTSSSFHGFLAGNLCLHGDSIMRRRVELDHEPLPGDILAFVNTAGYNMDFAESHTLRQAVARKIAVTYKAGTMRYALDEVYDPREEARV